MRRITLVGIGLAAALAAVPAIALAQSSDPDPATTPVECPFQADHAGVHQQMHGASGTMMPGGGMQGMSGFGGMPGGGMQGMSGFGGMPGHSGMHQQMGSMMGQMNSMMSPQG